MLKPCKTLDEFVRKYDKDLERILCKSFRKFINIEELPEVKNDVYMHLLEKNFFNNYDPSKAQFSTYLYTYLFKFLKSKKVKTDKDPSINAYCIDTPLFDDSSATLADLKELSDTQSASDILIDAEIQRHIKEMMHGRNEFNVYNPHQKGTLEYKAWEFLSEPRTVEEVEKYAADNFPASAENPYHARKDEIKHIVWNSFWKNWQRRIPITKDTHLWSNVPGVRKVIIKPETLKESDRVLFDFLKDTPKNHMDILCSGFEDSSLNNLLSEGYVEEVVFKNKRRFEYGYQSITQSYLTFSYAKNLAWHLIFLMKEAHPEFIEFKDGYYHVDTKTDVTYRVLQMILNGKTKKQITHTLNISGGYLNEAKASMLKDIKRLILDT